MFHLKGYIPVIQCISRKYFVQSISSRFTRSFLESLLTMSALNVTIPGFQLTPRDKIYKFDLDVIITPPLMIPSVCRRTIAVLYKTLGRRHGLECSTSALVFDPMQSSRHAMVWVCLQLFYVFHRTNRVK